MLINLFEIMAEEMRECQVKEEKREILFVSTFSSLCLNR
jgi:hypothetical protein